jgi:hypothetical protein
MVQEARMLTHRSWYRSLIILTIAVVVLSPNLSQGATLHAIIAGDAEDQNIGVGVEADIKHIWNLVQDIKQNIPWDRNSTVTVLESRPVLGGQVPEQSLTYENLLAALENVPAGADDLLFFYYSGHGAGDESGTTTWPNLFFANHYVAYDLIVGTLKAKGARLLIVVTDCCNNFRDWTPDSQINFRERMKQTATSQQNYRELFLNQRGYVIATSSQPGEISSAVSSRPGSLFTDDFLTRLYQELRSPGLPKWQNVKTAELTFEDQGTIFTQHPQYDIQTTFATLPSVPPSPQPTPAVPTPTPQVIQPIPTLPPPPQLPKPTPIVPLSSPHVVRPTPFPPRSFASAKLWLNKPCGAFYRPEEHLLINFQTRQEGYVIIYNIDTRNEVSVLFPNKQVPDNAVRAHTTYIIPDALYSYDLVVKGPRGVEYVKMLFSTDALYHRFYPQIQGQLESLLENVSESERGNYVIESCYFYVQ